MLMLSAQHPSAYSSAAHSTTSFCANLRTTLTVLMCPSATLQTLRISSLSPLEPAKLHRSALMLPLLVRSDLSPRAWRHWNAMSLLPTSLFRPIFLLLTRLSQFLHTRKLPGRSTQLPLPSPRTFALSSAAPKTPSFPSPPSQHTHQSSHQACLTQERFDALDLNRFDFLWPKEMKLTAHVLKVNEKALAWSEAERGRFRDDYFSLVKIPTITHTPWVHKNIPILTGLLDKVIEMFKENIAAGVYEPSDASYRSRWFCVPKKNGSLRLVHDLQPLNAVTIRNAAVLPFDITLATFLVPNLANPLSTAELIATQIRQLQRREDDLAAIHTNVLKSRFESVQQFERQYVNTIRNFDFQPGALVLVQNSSIEMDLSRKAKPRYIGPMVVVRRTQNGSYRLAELDGAVSNLRFAAFHLVPYHACTRTSIPVTCLVDRSDIARVFADEDVVGLDSA